MGSIRAVFLLAASFALRTTLSAKVGTQAAATTPINHIIIFVKENHSFDNYFGTFPGANGATTYTSPTGTVLPLNHDPDKLAGDIDHSHQAVVTAEDKGKMDKFSKINGAIQTINGTQTDVSDGQYYQSDIPNYWQYAQNFTLADNFYSAIAGPSFPNHLYTIAGQNADVDNNPTHSFVNGNNTWGCDSPSTATVEERRADGTIQDVFPCFEFPTLADTLMQNGLTWKYYAPSATQRGMRGQLMMLLATSGTRLSGKQTLQATII